MRRTTSFLVAYVCLALAQAGHAQDYTILPTDDPNTTTLGNETSNNTSACVANGSPSYCNEALPNLTTSTANQNAGAQTTVVDAFPEHVSTITVNRLMNHGQAWPGKIICEYQPWFGNVSPYNSHIDIGYDENTLATVTNQDAKMINRGCNINLIDFYGTTDSAQQFNLTSTNNVYTDLSGRSNYPLRLGILEDENAFKTDCLPSGQTEAGAISCIEGALEADMKYISENYANVTQTAGLYWTDQGTNVVGFYGACGDFAPLSCPGDWNTIWSSVQTYADNNSYNFKFIFNFGNFDRPTISAGEYAWPQPYVDATNSDNFIDNPPSQFWWCDPTGITCDGTSGGYLDQFYEQAESEYTDGKVIVGLLYSGFDDSNASWGTDRVIAQQCGRILLDTANEPNLGGYWGTTAQIPYMQMATWNDYEEASEEESGIDNCYTAVNLSYESGSSSEMQWTLSISSAGAGYATTNTVHHYALWTAPHGGTTLTLRKQLGPTLTKFNLSTLDLPEGSYDVYLEMVGQPSIQNEMSGKLEYTQN